MEEWGVQVSPWWGAVPTGRGGTRFGPHPAGLAGTTRNRGVPRSSAASATLKSRGQSQGWWKTRCTGAGGRRRVGPAADSNAAIRSAHEPETAEAPGPKNSPASVRTPAGNPAPRSLARAASFTPCKTAAFPAQATGSEAVAGGSKASLQRAFARPAAADFGNPSRTKPGSESLPKTARQARPEGRGGSRSCGGSRSPSTGAEGESGGQDSGRPGGITRGTAEKDGVRPAFEGG